MPDGLAKAAADLCWTFCISPTRVLALTPESILRYPGALGAAVDGAVLFIPERLAEHFGERFSGFDSLALTERRLLIELYQHRLGMLGEPPPWNQPR